MFDSIQLCFIRVNIQNNKTVGLLNKSQRNYASNYMGTHYHETTEVAELQFRSNFNFFFFFVEGITSHKKDFYWVPIFDSGTFILFYWKSLWYMHITYVAHYHLPFFHLLLNLRVPLNLIELDKELIWHNIMYNIYIFNINEYLGNK